jgi:lincosamide nucleotidyltransferase A/C/D/E
MTSSEVIAVVDCLSNAGIEVWLDGGWGVDALLEEETRPHEDLDAVVELAKTDSVIAALGPPGFQVSADDRPTRLVLRAGDGRQIDFHPVVFDEDGNGRQIGAGPNGGDAMYPADGLTSIGIVSGRRVACLTPELLLKHHQGYPPKENDRHNVRLLCERFGLPLPRSYAEGVARRATGDALD